MDLLVFQPLSLYLVIPGAISGMLTVSCPRCSDCHLARPLLAALMSSMNHLGWSSHVPGLSKPHLLTRLSHSRHSSDSGSFGLGAFCGRETAISSNGMTAAIFSRYSNVSWMMASDRRCLPTLETTKKGKPSRDSPPPSFGATQELCWTGAQTALP